MKRCNVCGIDKELSEYEKAKTCKDGYRGTCKMCRLESRRIHTCKCLSCGVVFKSQNKNANYCSAACIGVSRQEKIIVNCDYCGEEKVITPSLKKLSAKHYCNQGCRTKHLKILMAGENNPIYNKVEYKCDGCNKDILVNPYQINTQKNIFCSNKCYKDNIGKHYSGKNNSNWNDNLTQEDREDLRRYPEYYQWRLDVYERDDFTCRKCGDNAGGNLIAHHIYNYSEHKELRTTLSNGITFCGECHLGYHKHYGYRNNNKKQLIEFINDKAL